ncbi:hypothetical protein ES705_33281 [subsurface metagenome]
MKIFILVGFQLTGKSSHGHKMEIEENVPMIETGHAVYYDLQRQGLETNHVNTSKVIKDLLSRDPTAFAQAILEFEEKKYKDSSIMLFNGIKSPAEIDYIKKRFGKENVRVVGFHACQLTRFGRVRNSDRFVVSGRFQQKKQEDEDLAHWENFTSRDIREIGLGIGIAFSLANEIIITENIQWPYYGFELSYKDFKNYIFYKKN